MKVDVYYFSGTGNTAWVVQRLAERLTDLGDEVTAWSCEELAGSSVDPAACDVMGIAFPIHASLVPAAFREFLDPLPPGEGRGEDRPAGASDPSAYCPYGGRRSRGAALWCSAAQRCMAESFESWVFQGFYANGECTGCGWCVRHCPVHNIERTDGGASFGDECTLCMRCYSFCPAQAIQSTEKTRDVRKYRRYQGPEGRTYSS